MPKPSSNRVRNQKIADRPRGKGRTPDFRFDPTTANDNAVPKRHVRPMRDPIRPLNEAQGRYDAALRSSAIVFGTGPAGTGKTFLAACRAAEAYANGEIERIVITRPNVEAAEDGMGYLPGELEEKFEPYFRPVREALEKVLGTGALEYAIKSGDIEARPLAFLRGATLENCWVIADEMQNATKTQMKLLLSRIGENAKFIVNGDEDQCDLPNPAKSGLMDAVRRLKPLRGVSTVAFTVDDIVRSGLCAEIVRAYAEPRVIAAYNDASDVENDDAGLKRTLQAA